MANALFNETEKRVFGDYLRRDYYGDDYQSGGKQKSLPPPVCAKSWHATANCRRVGGRRLHGAKSSIANCT
tara:strand:- start:786 stop:998 length:213 start_codon:yes stop_codon:yes gene_type:complete